MSDRHLDDAGLLAALDGETPGAQAHLAGCPACRERADALQREAAQLDGLLASLDHPLVRPAPAAELFRRAARPRRRAWVRLTLAGGLTVATALAAAALPSSPVHRWLVRRPAAVPAAAASSAAPSAPLQSLPAAAGVVIPHPAAMTIVVQHAQAAGTLVVTLTADSDVTIGARGGDVAYDVSDSGVTVRNRVAATEFDVALPVALRATPIYVGGVRVYPTGRAPDPGAAPGETRYRIPLGSTGQ